MNSDFGSGAQSARVCACLSFCQTQPSVWPPFSLPSSWALSLRLFLLLLLGESEEKGANWAPQRLSLSLTLSLLCRQLLGSGLAGSAELSFRSNWHETQLRSG